MLLFFEMDFQQWLALVHKQGANLYEVDQAWLLRQFKADVSPVLVAQLVKAGQDPKAPPQVMQPQIPSQGSVPPNPPLPVFGPSTHIQPQPIPQGQPSQARVVKRKSKVHWLVLVFLGVVGMFLASAFWLILTKNHMYYRWDSTGIDYGVMTLRNNSSKVARGVRVNVIVEYNPVNQGRAVGQPAFINIGPYESRTIQFFGNGIFNRPVPAIDTDDNNFIILPER